MNWEAVGAIGEVTGAVGVITTLLYLSVQVRQSVKATRASMTQQTIDRWIQINLFICENAKIFGPENEQQTALDGFFRALFHQWSNVFNQHDLGGLDDEMLDATLKDVEVRLKENDMMMKTWKIERLQYPEKFRLFVDDCIKNLDT